MRSKYSSEPVKVCQTSSGKVRFRAARRFTRSGGVLLLLVGLAAGSARAEKVEQLSPQGYVNDFAGVIDGGSKGKISELCQELDSKAQAQIAVVTIKTLEGDTEQDFASRLFQKWGIGPKGSDRGVMILLAVDEHRYWTEVGYGLEPILPDGKVGGFGRQMVPLLRQNAYGAALLQMTGQVAGVIAQDKGVALGQAPAPVPSGDGDSGPDGIPPQLIFFLIILLLFGGWRLLTFILIALGLMRPRPNRPGYRGGGWWIGPTMGGGGFGGGFGGGGGGFGGFGGGMSGGGGAGGGW